MNYACRSDRPFSTAKNIKTKTVLTEEMKSRRSYIRSHTFSVVVNPETKEAHVKVTEKKNAN